MSLKAFYVEIFTLQFLNEHVLAMSTRIKTTIETNSCDYLLLSFFFATCFDLFQMVSLFVL